MRIGMTFAIMRSLALTMTTPLSTGNNDNVQNTEGTRVVKTTRKGASYLPERDTMLRSLGVTDSTKSTPSAEPHDTPPPT